MKKIFTLVMALAATSPLYAETLFTADLNTQEGFDAWTVIDANADEKTWVFSADNDEGSRVYYSYHSTNQGDDWLISPAITPTADGPLMIRYTFKGSYYKESAEVCCGNAPTAEAMTTVLGSYPDMIDQDYGYFVIVDGVAGQPIYVGVHATSSADRWRLYLKSFSVETATEVIDLKLTEIVSPVTGRDLGQETVTVKIANAGRTDVASYNVSFAINGETAVTETVNETLAAGAETTYTFTAKADLSTPRELYTFSATVTAEGDIEASNNTLETEVRHIAPATAPYFTGFEPGEYFDEFKSFNLNEDEGDWEIGVGSLWWSMARTGLGYLGYNYDKNNNADDWFIIEPIKVEAGYYALKFWFSGDDNHPEKFSVHYGDACDPAAMTNKIVEYAPFAVGAYQESINILHFDAPQTIYIGFYAFSDKDENWITIDDLSLERIEATDIDIAATSLISPTPYLPVKAPHDVTFVAKNLGITAQTATVTVTLDETEVYSGSVEFAAQEEKTLNVGGLLADVAAGEHTLVVNVNCEGDINAENNVLTQTFILLGEPDIIYDFEDGKVPADFTFTVKDEGTLDPSAVAEFGETGWGIVSIGDHTYYGSKMLGGSSWVNGVENLDRSCILPKVTVDTDDACFVWNAGSISPYFFESYQVRVLYEDPVWGPDYSKLAEVTIEGTNRQYRGVSLGKFKGQEVEVEIRLISKPGDAITLDNLQLFGCTKVNQGVESVAADAKTSIRVRGNVITVNTDAVITVTDMSGRVVAAGEGTSLNISNLNPGVYVVTAGAATAKIVR